MLVVRTFPESGKLQPRILAREIEGDILLRLVGEPEHRRLDRILDPAPGSLEAPNLPGIERNIEIRPSQSVHAERIDGIQLGILAVPKLHRLLSLVGQKHLHSRAKDGESVAKLLSAVLRKADESELGRVTVEIVILLSARSQPNGGKVLRAAAQVYKVDTDAIALKVKQELVAKEKAKSGQKVQPKPAAKTSKKAA